MHGFRRIVHRPDAYNGKESLSLSLGNLGCFFPFATGMPQCTTTTCLANLDILPRRVEQRQGMVAYLDEMIGKLPAQAVGEASPRF